MLPSGSPLCTTHGCSHGHNSGRLNDDRAVTRLEPKPNSTHDFPDHRPTAKYLGDLGGRRTPSSSMRIKKNDGAQGRGDTVLFQGSVNRGSCLLEDMASRAGLMSSSDTQRKTGTATMSFQRLRDFMDVFGFNPETFLSVKFSFFNCYVRSSNSFKCRQHLKPFRTAVTTACYYVVAGPVV